MKTVLITGSSKGLGRSLALMFARNKYNVIIHGRDEPALAEVEGLVLENDLNCRAILGDLSSQKTLDKLYEIAAENELDVLINNAAMHVHKPLGEMSEKEMRRIIEINLIVPVQLTMKIYPLMRAKKSGIIININSMAATVANELEAAYVASKHGLRGFARSLRYEATRHGVRVVSVYLGAMRTGMTSYRIDWDRLISPDEAAGVIANICKEYKSLTIDEIDLRRIK